MARRCGWPNAGVFRYEPQVAEVRGLRHLRLRQSRTATPSTAGARTSSSTAPARSPYHGTLVLGPVDFPTSTAARRRSTNSGRAPAPASSISRSRHFPDEMQGNLLVANVIGFQGILRYKIEDKGASFAGTELEPILSSSDPNFRPSDLEIGPGRGDLYFTRLAEPDHRPHAAQPPRSQPRPDPRPRLPRHLRRPAALKPAKIAGEPIDKLLDCSRIAAKTGFAIGPRSSSAAARRMKSCRPSTVGWPGSTRAIRDYEHDRLEALWIYQYHNVVNVALLERVLASTDFQARAAATRVLCYLARPRAATHSSGSRSWRPTSIRASGSRRSARPASSTCPRRSKWP